MFVNFDNQSDNKVDLAAERLRKIKSEYYGAHLVLFLFLLKCKQLAGL